MKNVFLPILSLATIGLAIALAFSHLKQSGLEEENRGLRHQLEALSAARAESVPNAAAANSQQTQTEPADSEIVRLRGEVTNLRREKAELEKVRAENQKLLAQAKARAQTTDPGHDLSDVKIPGSHPREKWSFTGYADPESALQSVLWAATSSDAATILAGFTPEEIGRMQKEDTTERSEAEVAERVTKEVGKIKSFQILKNEPLSDNETVLTFFVDGPVGGEQTPKLKMQRVGNEWRIAGPYDPEQAKAANQPQQAN
jgi:hypothetical protein